MSKYSGVFLFFPFFCGNVLFIYLIENILFYHIPGGETNWFHLVYLWCICVCLFLYLELFPVGNI